MVQITDCHCSFCTCILPVDPKRGYCYECMKIECWSAGNRWRAHFLHDQCQEYYDSLMVELGE